jgi:hypothetical protein
MAQIRLLRKLAMRVNEISCKVGVRRPFIWLSAQRICAKASLSYHNYLVSLCSNCICEMRLIRYDLQSYLSMRKFRPN